MKTGGDGMDDFQDFSGNGNHLDSKPPIFKPADLDFDDADTSSSPRDSPARGAKPKDVMITVHSSCAWPINS